MWYPAKISHGPGMSKRISAARQQARSLIETDCNLQSLTETVVRYFGYGDVVVHKTWNSGPRQTGVEP